MPGRQVWLLGAGLALVACQAQPPAGTKPSAARPRSVAAPTTAPDAPATAPLGLPVGPSPQAKSDAGASPATSVSPLLGRVLLPDGQGAAGLRVVATLLSDRGTGLLSNHGGGLIGNHGGGLIGNHGGGYRLAQAPAGSLEATTDAEGRYRIDLPAGAAYNLESGTPDEALKGIAVAATQASGPVTLRLDKPGELSLRVQVAEGEISDYTGVTVFVPGTSYAGFTGATGQVVLSKVPAGSFPIVAMSDRLGQGLLSDVAVISGQLRTESRRLILSRPPVKLTAISSPFATPNQELTLTGTAFGKSQGAKVEVRLGGAVMPSPTLISDESLRFTVPPTANSGDLEVVVDGFRSNPLPLFVAQRLHLRAPEELDEGAQVQLQAWAQDRQGVTRRDLPWTFRVAAGASAATVDARGVVKGLAQGTGTFEMALGGMKLGFKIAVQPGLGQSAPGAETALFQSLLPQLALDAVGQRLLLANQDGLVQVGLANRQASPLAGRNRSQNVGFDDLPKAKDGTGEAADMANVHGFVLTGDRQLVFVDDGELVRRCSPTGAVGTWAGQPFGQTPPEVTGATNFHALGQDAYLPNLDGLLASLADGSVLLHQHAKGQSGFVRVASDGRTSDWGSPAPMAKPPLGLLPDGSGGAWLLTPEGLVRATAAGQRSLAVGALDEDEGALSFRAMCPGPEGAVWALAEAGTEGWGVYAWSPGEAAWTPVLALGPEGELADGPLEDEAVVASPKALAWEPAGNRLWLLDDGALRSIDLEAEALDTHLRSASGYGELLTYSSEP